MNLDEYADTVTNRILAEIEKGVSPWVKPWASTGNRWPTNAVSGHRYQGMNALYLSLVDIGGSGLFATYQQWLSEGAQVRKGEKSVPALRPIELRKDFKDAAEGKEPERLLLFKPFAVFSIDQVDGADHLRPAPVTLKPVERNETIDAAVFATGATILPHGSQCFYKPDLDTIHMVEAGAFETMEHFYATEFHELAHWTGAKSRLDRDLTGTFKSHSYAAEELIAELTSAFCCQHFGVDGLDRHMGAYLASWASLFREDKKAILKASGQAAKAFKFLAPEASP